VRARRGADARASEQPAAAPVPRRDLVVRTEPEGEQSDRQVSDLHGAVLARMPQPLGLPRWLRSRVHHHRRHPAGRAAPGDLSDGRVLRSVHQSHNEPIERILRLIERTIVR